MRLRQTRNLLTIVVLATSACGQRDGSHVVPSSASISREAFDAEWSAPRDASSNYLPRWSPNQSQLLFYRRLPEGWRVFLIDSDGGNLRRLTDGPGNDYQPAWSADGTAVAFDSDRNGNRDVYRLSLDGGAIVNITNAPARDVMPAWAPDDSVAFVSDREDGPHVWVTHPDTNTTVRVTAGRRWRSIVRPAWSPDGQRLAFAATEDTGATGPGDGSPTTRRLFVVNRDGSALMAITPPGDAANPAWSPDGTRLVFDATPEGRDASEHGEFELFIVRADGRTVQRLTHDRVNDWGPSWSPDGAHIAFARGLNDQYEIFTMPSGGGPMRRITRLVYP